VRRFNSCTRMASTTSTSRLLYEQEIVRSAGLRASLLAVVLAEAACHHAVRRDDAKGGAALCARLDAENAAAIAALSGGERTVPDVAGLAAALRAGTACTPTRDGGWGIRLSGVQNQGGDIWGRWSIVHGGGDSTGVAPDTAPGAPASGGPESVATASNLQWTANRRIVPLAPVLYDFDADGEPEAIVIVETVDVAESGRTTTTRRGRVWRGRGTAVELSPSARELTVEEVRDVDGDGRPDLVTHGPYVGFAAVKCGSEDIYPVLGPPLLAHAVVGGRFELADATAIGFARASCAATPADVMVVEAGGQGVDLPQSARNIACARLRGQGTTPLLARITDACAPPPGAACQPCDEPALLERWARLPPVLRVP